MPYSLTFRGGDKERDLDFSTGEDGHVSGSEDDDEWKVNTVVRKRLQSRTSWDVGDVWGQADEGWNAVFLLVR